jgi:tetratricopeptide (TPR) repeat protein
MTKTRSTILLGAVMLLTSLGSSAVANTSEIETLYTSGDCSPIFVGVNGAIDLKCGITAEQAYWDAVSSSTKIIDFENYLQRYPNGRFIDAAEIKLIELRQSYGNAILHFKTALRHVEAIGVGGEVSFIQEQNERALLNLKLAIENYPYFAEAHFEMGRVFWWQKDYAKALEAFKRAIDVNPVYSEAYLYEGFSYENMGEQVLACESFISFQATNNYLPDHVFEHLGLAMMAFSSEFLTYRGCRAPEGFRLGKTLEEHERKLDCETTSWSDELEQCFQMGNARAMHERADSIWIEAWNSEDPVKGREALEIWQKLADRGDPRGYWGVAWITDHELVVPLDCAKMIDYYQKAAEADYPEALNSLARHYTDEQCLPRDVGKARMLYARSAALGDVHGQSMIENIDSCKSNPEHWLQPCEW